MIIDYVWIPILNFCFCCLHIWAPLEIWDSLKEHVLTTACSNYDGFLVLNWSHGSPRFCPWVLMLVSTIRINQTVTCGPLFICVHLLVGSQLCLCNMIWSCMLSLACLLVYVLCVATTVKLCSGWPQILKYLPSDLSQNKFVGPVVGPWRVQFTLPKRQKAIWVWILLALIKSSVSTHVYLALEGNAVLGF